jgi:hypothetical protein
MKGAATVIRIAGWLVGVLGVGQIAVVLLSDPPVNHSGFVPGAVFGFMLLVGAFCLLAFAGLLRERAPAWQYAALGAITVWLLGGSYLVVWPSHGWATSIPFGLVIAAVAWAGLFFTASLVGIAFIVFPVMLALALVIDQIPFLRRHGGGEAFLGRRRPG